MQSAAAIAASSGRAWSTGASTFWIREHLLEVFEEDRLGEVVIESGFASASAVVGLAVSGDGDERSILE
jgi:hypothetical protein